MNNKTIYGYFSAIEQDKPAFDPGLDVNCPFCNKGLSMPIKTISFAPIIDKNLSYFYRAHKNCYETAKPEQIQAIESLCIDDLKMN